MSLEASMLTLDAAAAEPFCSHLLSRLPRSRDARKERVMCAIWHSCHRLHLTLSEDGSDLNVHAFS